MKVRKPKEIMIFATRYSVSKDSIISQSLGQNWKPLGLPLPALKRLSLWILKAIAYLEQKK